MQIALVLPCAAFIGWLIGAWLDTACTRLGSQLPESSSAASPVWCIRFEWLWPQQRSQMQDDDSSGPRRAAEDQGVTEEHHSLVSLTDDGLQALLKRAIRITLIVGALAALVLWKASGWPMRHAGHWAAISAASIHEWRRLIRFMNAKWIVSRRPVAQRSRRTFVLRLESSAQPFMLA